MSSDSPYRKGRALPPGHIRLLRILSSRLRSAPVSCELFDYLLVDTALTGGNDDDRNSVGMHAYQALSYVWGTAPAHLPHAPPTIVMDGCVVAVTVNLFNALTHLRHRNFERVMWIDAVCIRQDDLTERGQQVQLMAEIYSRASLVVIWLGEPRSSPTEASLALEEIRSAAESAANITVESRKPASAVVISILRCAWFRRVWVLQEVAAARSVLIMYGAAEIDGFAFAAGINTMSYEGHADLEALISSATFLIRDAVFRKREHEPLGDGQRFTLNIRPLGELISMYSDRDSTLLSDKIFALLNMSSDENIPPGLIPDYSVRWGHLYESLLRYLLGDALWWFTIWHDSQLAIFTVKCAILGLVKSVETRLGSQYLSVALLKPLYWEDEKYSGWIKVEEKEWSIPVPARLVKVGDIICQCREGASPMILRPHHDYYSIVTISFTLPADMGEETITNMKHIIENEVGFFLCTWDVGINDAATQKVRPPPHLFDDAVAQGRSMPLGSHGAMSTDHHPIIRYPSRFRRLSRISSMLKRTGRLGQATEIMAARDSGLDEDHPDTMDSFRGLIDAYVADEKLRQAIEAFDQLLFRQRVVFGEFHPVLAQTILEMALVKEKMAGNNIFRFEKKETLRMRLTAMVLAGKDTGAFDIDGGSDSDDDYAYSSTSSDFNLEHTYGSDSDDSSDFNIEYPYGSGDDNSSKSSGSDDSDDEKLSTADKILVKAATLEDMTVLEMIFTRGDKDSKVTEKAMCTAAGNPKAGLDMMQLIFKQLKTRGVQRFVLTEPVAVSAAKNRKHGLQILQHGILKEGEYVQPTLRLYRASRENNKSHAVAIVKLLMGQGRQPYTSRLIIDSSFFSVGRAFAFGRLARLFKVLVEHGGREKIYVTQKAVGDMIAAADGDTLDWLTSAEGLNMGKVTKRTVSAGLKNGRNVLEILVGKYMNSADGRRTALQITAGAVHRVVFPDAGKLLGHIDHLKTLLRVTKSAVMVLVDVGGSGSLKYVLARLLHPYIRALDLRFVQTVVELLTFAMMQPCLSFHPSIGHGATTAMAFIYARAALERILKYLEVKLKVSAIEIGL